MVLAILHSYFSDKITSASLFLNALSCYVSSILILFPTTGSSVLEGFAAFLVIIQGILLLKNLTDIYAKVRIESC